MNKIKKTLKFIWEQIKLPIIMFVVFFFGGIGLYHGIMVATNLGKITMHSAVVISFIELQEDEQEQ